MEKFKLIKQVEAKSAILADGTTYRREVYNIGHYIVIRITTHDSEENEYVRFNIYENTEYGELPFLPQLYAFNNLDTGKVEQVTVQTTSYGDLNLRDMEAFMFAMGHGMAVAKYLTDYFCKGGEQR